MCFDGNVSFNAQIIRVRRVRRVCLAWAGICLLVSVGAAGQTAAPSPAADGGLIQGIVHAGRIPIPGASISATNVITKETVTTASDINGQYSLHVSNNGRYVVRAEMTAFSPVEQQVAIAGPAASVQSDFELTLLSRTQQAQPASPPGSRPSTAGAGRGFPGVQEESLDPGAAASSGIEGQMTAPGMPATAMDPNAATESVAVSGNASSSAFAGMSSDEIRQRMQDAREQGNNSQFGGPGGGPGPRGGGRGGGGGGPGAIIFASRRGGFDANRPHGSIFYSAGDSALDAAPYSLTGANTGKPSYIQQRFGVNLGGPLKIPKIYNGGDKNFYFISYNGSRADNPYDAFSTVPTLAERQGDFSQTVVPNGPLAGTPAQIINPQTGTQFPNNVIPSSQVNRAAQGLLQFIPPPNLPGEVQNFHFVISALSNSDDLNFRIMHNFGAGGFRPGRRGPRNSINAGFHYHSADTRETNPFPSVGGNNSVQGFDIPVGYVRSFGKLTNIARVDYNRNRISTNNLYAFQQNVAGGLGIAGVSQNPFDWGLPQLSFTNFSGLSDINPLLRRDQTLQLSDSMIWTHGAHTLRWGGDFRRIQLNTETDSNSRGSFTFTGARTAATVNGVPQPGTGFDFADFLLGLPQLTSVQFGANNYHFRGNSWDLFVQDEWRVRGNLSLNLGLRYEYVSPFSEINNLIVNLDVAPGFTAVAPVLPGNAGPFSGVFPRSLVNPDRNNFAPRVGIAWKPFNNTVVRAGYGINYNTGAYANIAQQLAFQPPFSVTQTNIASPILPLTLQAGFPTPAPAAITNNYGVDRNYRLGYVQIWNLDIQRELRPDLLLNLDYTGTKGTHLDIVEAPNRTATGLRIPGVQPFLFESSDGDSVAHAASVRIRKRLQHGVSIGGTYTFSKSLDDASSIGGGATVVAQDAFDLAAERGLSSFDQTHRFTADYLWATPWGHDKRWLSGPGVMRTILGDWQLSGDWTIASGLPFTPRVLGNFADVNRGTNGTLRADVTGIPVALSDPSVNAWFNTAAFAEPPPGQFGDAGRNTIRGPGSAIFNMAFTKLLPLSDTQVVELRAQASNIFNAPQFSAIDTIVNSPSFGRVISVASMRKFQMSARYRF
jgi:trimeric autotransporter adhesin